VYCTRQHPSGQRGHGYSTLASVNVKNQSPLSSSLFNGRAVVCVSIRADNKILKSRPLWGEGKTQSVSCNHCKDCSTGKEGFGQPARPTAAVQPHRLPCTASLHPRQLGVPQGQGRSPALPLFTGTGGGGASAAVPALEQTSCSVGPSSWLGER